jgi:hypothetical protein
MTLKQTQWASQHDWFNGASKKKGEHLVHVTEAWSDGTVRKMNFINFNDLINWAGY